MTQSEPEPEAAEATEYTGSMVRSRDGSKLGTLVGVLLTAGLGAWATGAAHLTGLGGELSLDLLSYAPEVSLRGVLLCGLVLAGLGGLGRGRGRGWAAALERGRERKGLTAARGGAGVGAGEWRPPAFIAGPHPCVRVRGRGGVGAPSRDAPPVRNQ